MSDWLWIGGTLVAVLAGLSLLGGWLRRRERTAPLRAVRHFPAVLPELLTESLRQSQASGRPSGLRWVEITSAGEPLFVRHPGRGELAVRVPVQIRFEAIEGGEMEDIAAVPLPRSGTAIFRHICGKWQVGERIRFNISPEELLRQPGNEWERFPPTK
jgi:hypothetical protein